MVLYKTLYLDGLTIEKSYQKQILLRKEYI